MGRCQWIKPVRKYKKRIHDIKVAHASISLNAYDYNARVLPVLSYVSQLVPLPAHFPWDQRIASHTVYHAPFNTFAHSEFFIWAELGLPKLRCGIAAANSALGRTALRTVSRWKEWVPQLRAVANEHLPLARSSRSVPCLSPPGWDSPSFAETLW